MIVDLENTTTNVVNKKLDGLREEGGAFTMARVLTLVIAPDSETVLEESIEAGNAASREHPCRVIVVSEPPDKPAGTPVVIPTCIDTTKYAPAEGDRKIGFGG